MNNLNVMIGKTISQIIGGKGSEELIFIDAETEEKYIFYHEPDCCERVRIEDICGDLNDLINTPLFQVEETKNRHNPPQGAESHLWTFYHFTTAKGTVVIRWLGESNGYYSESVWFKISPDLDEKCKIMSDQDLSPKNFTRYFLTVKDLINWQEIKYNNPDTQELLKKALLLV